MGNYSDELDTVNNTLALTFLPVIVVISIYMVIGLFGNPLVAIYYGCHAKPSPSCHFIVAMAVFDIITCCVSMPLEIVDMRFPYEFPSKAACKILRFVNYFASISSGLVLVAIATDRYRKVCQPFKNQISTKLTKIIIGIVCLFSIFVSWPALVFYDLHVATNIGSVPGVIGYDCTFTREEDYKIYITLYNGVCFLIFIGCIMTLTVLYILIGRKLCRLNRFRFSAITRKSKNGDYTPPTSSSDIDLKYKLRNVETLQQQTKQKSIPETRSYEVHNMTTISQKVMTQDQHLQGSSSLKARNMTSEKPLLQETELKDYANLSEVTRSKELKTKHKTSSLSECSDSDTDIKHPKPMLKTRISSRTCIIKRQRKLHDQYIHLKKYTILMLFISLAFAMSFLPYLGLITWRTLAPNYERNLLSKSELIVFNIFIRSWMISSVVNPLIYGFFNKDFRSFVSLFLRRCCCCFCRMYDDERHDT